MIAQDQKITKSSTVHKAILSGVVVSILEFKLN